MSEITDIKALVEVANDFDRRGMEDLAKKTDRLIVAMTKKRIGKTASQPEKN